jgi:uncharacterized membrane protein YdjX (TVP38/TMEM64 family)
MKKLLIIVILTVIFIGGAANSTILKNYSVYASDTLIKSESFNDSIKTDKTSEETYIEKEKNNEMKITQQKEVIKTKKSGFFKEVYSYLVNRKKLENLITGLGVWGPLAYIVIYILVAITLIPALPITVASGIIFGPIMGVVYTVIGAGIGLSLSFLIARYVARGAIEKKFGNTEAFKKIDEGVKRNGWFILATTRLLPIFSFGLQNYIYGLTSIGFVQYAVLSIIFILPGTSIYVMLAGAFVSGDKAIVLKYSITASLIFLGLMVVTKVIKKKIENQEKKENKS